MFVRGFAAFRQTGIPIRLLRHLRGAINPDFDLVPQSERLTARLFSFGDSVRLEDGNVMELELARFGLASRRPDWMEGGKVGLSP